MDFSILVLLLASSFTALLLEVEPQPISKITVVGTVFCDTCSNNTFSKHSYFLQGVEVHLECRFRANSTAEQVTLSVNRTTNKYGVYEFKFPSVNGFRCKEGHEVGSVCKASLLRSSSSLCNVPGLKKSTESMAIKSKQDHLCFYSLNALNYRPPKRDLSLCGSYKGESSSSLNVSEFFLPPFDFPPIPYLPPFPPFAFPFPPLPQLPPFPPLPQLPPLPPLPQFPPFPPLPQFPPFPPLPQLPPLPPLPQLPPLPPLPSLPNPFHSPPTPAPPFLFPPSLPLPPTPSIFTPSPPPPPPLSLSNPRSWFPFVPSSSPPPPNFSLKNPRTWIPFLHPSPPNNPQNQKP